MKITTSLFELFFLWSAIFAYDSFVCTSTSVPRFRLANGTVLSLLEEVIMEYGDPLPLELFCTGNATYLQMSKNYGELVIADIVNETTVRFLAENPERQSTYYCCQDSQSKNYTCVRVVVDSPPFVTDFHCKSKNLKYLNCTWTSLNVIPKFSLYFIKEEISHILCKLDMHESMVCVWDSKNPSIPYQEFDHKLTFLMETCTSLGCAKQTFVFNHDAIIQPDPPKFSLVWKSFKSAALKWNIPLNLWIMTRLEHRIGYWYFGFHQIQIVTASVEEKNFSVFEFELKLPCAGTFYEVRLSIKPITAVGEEFWSEDTVIYFVTDPKRKDDTTAVDPTCIRPRVTITPDIILYEIDKFRDKMEKEQNELKERIRSLKLRLQEN